MDIPVLMVPSWLVVSVWLAQLFAIFVQVQLHVLSVSLLQLFCIIVLVTHLVLTRLMTMGEHVQVAMLHV